MVNGVAGKKLRTPAIAMVALATSGPQEAGTAS